MKFEKLNGKLQEIFSINKYELYFSYLICFGFLVSFIISPYINKINSKENDIVEFEQVAEVIYQKLDSLEKADQSTYIGTDIAGNVNTKLAKGDTIIKPVNDFPSFKKKTTPSSLIDLNKATKFELMKLPGVGDKTADVIIAYRISNPFSKIEDIMNIKGIGPKKFEKMKEFIKVN